MTRLLKKVPLWVVGLALTVIAFSVEAALLNDVRLRHHPDRTRLVFDLSDSVQYRFLDLDNPARIAIDLIGIEDVNIRTKFPNLSPNIKDVRVGRHQGWIRYVVEFKKKVDVEHFVLKPNEAYGDRIVVDMYPNGSRKKKSNKNLDFDHSMRDDKFIVVIDPGHGGEDPGAVGAKRTYEKTVVLQIAKRLKKEIDSVPGMQAVLTRNGDYYISLRRRIQFAAEQGADLFLSIHADAFTKRSAKGISVFRLSRRGASSEEARLLAKKENASDLVAGEEFHHHNEDVQATFANMAYTKQIHRSTDLADQLLKQLRSVGNMHGNYVEHAGFVVLKSSIPSVLIETGFISNLNEEQRLKSGKYQAQLAKAIRKGIVAFVAQDPVVKETAWYKSRA